MKTPKEILLEIVPKDCYWEDMDNLTNTPIHYVIEAMESYAKQKLQQHSVMQAEGSEETRRKFCLWYYAQSQPLDANKVFEWFRAEGATVGQRSGDTVAEGEVLCVGCKQPKDEDEGRHGFCQDCLGDDW